MLSGSILLCGISCTSDPPPLNCYIHLPTIVAIMTFGPYARFNCSWISTCIRLILVKNLIIACTSHAEYSFTGTSIFTRAYLTFYWSIRLEIFTVCVQTQKLNFPLYLLHFVNHRSILASAILTFQMTLILGSSLGRYVSQILIPFISNSKNLRKALDSLCDIFHLQEREAWWNQKFEKDRNRWKCLSRGTFFLFKKR